VFHDRPVAVMGASAGRFGTILSQNALLPVLRTLRTRPWYEGRLMVSSAGDLVDDEGVLSDEETLKRLKKFVEGFIEFCEK
jgi:NAD(P)H-dependent FMN reductase